MNKLEQIEKYVNTLKSIRDNYGKKQGFSSPQTQLYFETMALAYGTVILDIERILKNND